MKLAILPLAVSLFALAACGPAFVQQKTKDYVLKESDVPASLPLPTVEYEFFGNQFSEQARVVEQHTSGTGGKFVVYGYATTIGGSEADAELSLYYKGRTAGADEWVAQWDFDGATGKKTITYKPGTTYDFVDTENFKLRVN